MRILWPHQFLLCKLRAVLNFPPWRRSFALDIMRSHLHAVPRKIMKNLSKYTSSSYLCCSISTTITTLVSKFKQYLWDPLGWTNRTAHTAHGCGSEKLSPNDLNLSLRRCNVEKTKTIPPKLDVRATLEPQSSHGNCWPTTICSRIGNKQTRDTDNSNKA